MNCVILSSGTIINLENITKVDKPNSWRSRAARIWFTGDTGHSELSETIDTHDYEVIVKALNTVNAIVIDDESE